MYTIQKGKISSDKLLPWRMALDKPGVKYLALRSCAFPLPAELFVPSTHPSCLLISPNKIFPFSKFLMAKSILIPQEYLGFPLPLISVTSIS